MFFYKEYKKTKFLFYTPIRLIHESIYQYVPFTIHTTHIEWCIELKKCISDVIEWNETNGLM